jgi:hypothetical protein
MSRVISNIVHSSGSWKFHFFAAPFLFAAVGGLPPADSNINITISVPAGTSEHGNPNLLCTPTKWLDILTFFLANYFAHAATVKAPPGGNTKNLAFVVFLAIASPFQALSGVSRPLYDMHHSITALMTCKRRPEPELSVWLPETTTGFLL